jgi:hypothetical protein
MNAPPPGTDLNEERSQRLTRLRAVLTEEGSVRFRSVDRKLSYYTALLGSERAPVGAVTLTARTRSAGLRVQLRESIPICR